MAKPRDYKAEYRRRIEKGLARGLTRSQASGHPKEGELPASAVQFVNPFRGIQEAFTKIVDRVREALAPLPKGTGQRKTTEVEYKEQYDQSGITILPRWSIGGEEEEPNIRDARDLWKESVSKRYQGSYTIVVCGSTEEDYPGHDKDNTCLSYRITRQTAQRAINRSDVKDLADLVNAMLPSKRKENWVDVKQLQILDKD